MPDVEEMAATAAETVAIFEAQCHRCRAGFPFECSTMFATGVSCTIEKRTAIEYGQAQEIILAITALTGEKPKRPKVAKETTGEPAAAAADAPRYDSGYIDPAVWVFSKDIGDFRDPRSTGRKAAAAMYKIPTGTVCDWAWKAGCGGGVAPVLGCPGHPATDIHHGPDKNTLNNAKASWGNGRVENIWLLCSFCHNTYHALNDALYPPRDWVADQRQPWLPIWPDGWEPFEMMDADPDEVLAEEARRKKEHARHGVTREGRNARREDVDGTAAGVVIDELGGDDDGFAAGDIDAADPGADDGAGEG